MKLKARLQALAEHFGYEVHKHPAVRRVRLLEEFDVDLVIDVGAASGAYATQLRRHGYTGRIVSIEPLEDAYARLSRHAERDPCWSTVCCALGDAPGNAAIHIAGNSDSSSLLPMLPRHLEAAPHTLYVGTQLTKVQRLDDLLPAIIGECERPFLKLDVQGFETAVLRGASASIGGLQGIQVEVSYVPLYEDAPMHGEVLTQLEQRGFSVVHVEPGFLDQASGQLLQADIMLMRLR